MADKDQLDQNPGERIRIPVNTSTANPADTGASTRAENMATIDTMIDKLSARDELSVDELVRNYEERYTGFRDGESDKVKRGASGIYEPMPRPKRYAVSTSNVSEDERMWAAIAHGSAVLTLLVGLLTGGLATLFTLFIPLGIYFAYRQRSQYVAYAALQSFALQVLGTVGWLVVLVGGVLVGGLLVAILAITVIGIPLAIIAAIILGLFVVATLVMPLGMGVYGAIAAWQSYQGKPYRYPWVGDWIDGQMRAGFLATL